MSPLTLLFILAVAVLAVRWYRDWVSRKASAASRSLLTWLGIGVVLFLAVTGRLGIIVPIVLTLFAALLRLAPLMIQFLPFFHRLWRERQSRQTGNAEDRNRSSAEAKFLRMDLNHSTGEIRGSVLCGRFAGRDLHTMTMEELVDLHQECREEDRDSAALLEAYLDRVHGDQWRTDRRSERSRAGVRTEITKDEAYQVLGLRPGASREAVIQAHRRLMQKLHPDRGGSDYLAAEINRAKEILLGNS